MPGPGAYDPRSLESSHNPGVGMHSSSQRFAPTSKENLNDASNLSMSSISDAEHSSSHLLSRSARHSAAPAPAVSGSTGHARLSASEASVRDAAVRRKQKELEDKEKMVGGLSIHPPATLFVLPVHPTHPPFINTYSCEPATRAC